jgi:DDE superfamily endonuclease
MATPNLDPRSLCAPNAAFAHVLGDIFEVWDNDEVNDAIMDAALSDTDSEYSYGYDDDGLLDADGFEHPEDLLAGYRFERSCPTFEYDGDLLLNVWNTNSIVQRNWNQLPAHKEEEKWVQTFRMSRETFQELFDLVALGLKENHSRHPQMRTYSKKDKLLITVFFLAHCPTLRNMSMLFGCPHNSICALILRPTMKAILRALYFDPRTKVVRFPSTEEEMLAVMADFHRLHNMPGCIGAIDGTLILMKKPTTQQAGGDADAYWCYKGGICNLCVVIVDANGLILYANAGSPGSVGDAGVFSRSLIKQQLDQGLAELAAVQLEVAGEEKQVTGYLVADSAFALNKYTTKCIDPPPAHGSAEEKFNRCVINARRGVECCFGRLKGRWVFCKKNTFYGNPAFCRDAVLSCVCLHNFVQVRTPDYDEENDEPEEDVVNVEGVQDGDDLRDLLVQWCGENT